MSDLRSERAPTRRQRPFRYPYLIPIYGFLLAIILTQIWIGHTLDVNAGKNRETFLYCARQNVNFAIMGTPLPKKCEGHAP